MKHPFRTLIVAASSAAFCVPGLAQTPPVTILEYEIDYGVLYRFDTPDVTKLATLPLAPPVFVSRTFMDGSFTGDIVAVNGKPAKGLWVNRHQLMTWTRTPQPGSPITDTTASGGPNMCQSLWAKPDGTIIGTLTCVGLAHHTVLGGTGIFFGARGMHVTVQQTRPWRYASVAEDPSRRRELGGGASLGTYYIYPAFRPEVEVSPQGPVILHAGDFSLVTQDKPARAGEILTLRAKGLGPTTPALLPPGARLFPSDPPDVVLAPVLVMVNKQEAEVINQIGWPGTYDTYRVDFRMPGGTPAGLADLQLILTWIPGPEVKLPVR